MVRLRLKFVAVDKDRHGNVRYYFRRGSEPKIRLRGEPGSAEFMASYDAALKGERPAKKTVDSVPVGSFAYVCRRYLASHEYAALDVRVQTHNQ